MLGVGFESAGFERDECNSYSLSKVAMRDESKFTYVPVGSREFGEAYVLKEKENGEYCWYGPQKSIRPTIGMRLMVWGGHFSDWIAVSTVEAYAIIDDPEGADKLVLGPEMIKFDPSAIEGLKEGDALILTRNSLYVARNEGTRAERYAKRKAEREAKQED